MDHTRCHLVSLPRYEGTNGAGSRGGGGLTLILSVGEGGTKVNFCLVRGGGAT